MTNEAPDGQGAGFHTAIELVRWIVRFSDWTRPQTRRALARATDEQLRQPGVITGGHGDGSIFATFRHIVGSEAFWLAGWTKTSQLPGPQESGDETLESLGQWWEHIHGIRAEWLADLDPSTLIEPFMELTSADGTTTITPIWPAIVHVVVHTGHHRSEIYEALTRFGVPPTEEPDMIDFAGVMSGLKAPTAFRFLD